MGCTKKYPRFLVCVPDTSPPSDAWPSFLCKVDHNDSLRVNTSNQPWPSSQPLHILSLLWTKTAWWSRKMSRNEGWSPAPHVRSKKDCYFSPADFVIMVSCYAIYTREKKISPQQTQYHGVLRYYQALLRYIHQILLCRIRDLICEGLLFCANNVWNDCVVLVRVRPTHEHLGRYIFLFSNTVVHLLT